MNYLYGVMGMLLIVVSGVLIDRVYTRFARRNPTLGPFRDKTKGCAHCAAAGSCADQLKKGHCS